MTGQRSNTRSDQTEKTIVCKTNNFVPLVVPGGIDLFWEQFVVNIDIAGFVDKSSSTAKWRTSSSGADHPQPRTKFKRGMTVEMRTTVCSIFLTGWRCSQIIQRTQKCMLPHSFLRTQIRNVLQKWYQNAGSTVFSIKSHKTEIAKSACEPKWQGLLAEDALAKLHLVQKSLVTW